MPYKISDLYSGNKFVAADLAPAFQMILRDPAGATTADETGATDMTEFLKAFHSPAWGITIYSGSAALAIPNGTYGPIYVPYNMTISAAEIVATPITGQSNGSITFDVYVDTYANWPPTVGDSIIGAGVKPALSSATKMQDSNISDYTTLTLTKGQRALFVVSGSSNLCTAQLSFTNVRTA